MAGDALRMVQLAQQMGSLVVFIYSFAIPVIVVSIVALIIGAIFHGQCAIEPNISIYLIVQGVLVAFMYSSILIAFQCLIMRMKSLMESMMKLKNTSTVLKITLVAMIPLIIIYFFTIAWNIAGSVWVFRAKSTLQTVDNTSSTYCQPVLYYYAFAYCIFFYVSLILYISVTCYIQKKMPMK